MGSDGQIVQHNDHMWNNALHEEAEQSNNAEAEASLHNTPPLFF